MSIEILAGLLAGFSVLSIVSLLIGIIALVELRSLNKSTHRIQYVDPKIDAENQAFLDKWSTSDEVINKQNKVYKEELEEVMPEFSTDEEDRYSF